MEAEGRERKTYIYGEKDSRLNTVVRTPTYVPQWNLRSTLGVSLETPLPADEGHHARPTKAAEESTNRMSRALSLVARTGRGLAKKAYALRYGYRLVGKIISVRDNAIADVLLRVPLGNNSEVVTPSENTLSFYESIVRIRLDVPELWENRKKVTTIPVDSDDKDLPYIRMCYR